MVIKTLTISLLFTILSAFTNKLPAVKTSPAYFTSTKNDLTLEIRLQKMDDLFHNMYKGLGEKVSKPSYPLFRKALLGYYNLLSQGKLSKKNVLTVIDFTLPSDKKRFWVIDLAKSKIVFNDLVAHGRNTGNIMARNFSNLPNSHMSSQGFYVTGNTYYGKHGLSLRLKGMETNFNDNAFERAIVMHGADYVSQEFIRKFGRLGRSYGCPSVSNQISKAVINAIKEESCLFIYSPALSYDTSSTLLSPIPVLEYLSTQSLLL